MFVIRQLSAVWQSTGTPALATFGGGVAAAIVALLVQLEVLVEMMSIGKLTYHNVVKNGRNCM